MALSSPLPLPILLLQELKQNIKSRGYTYSDVAKELGISESGFKKLINAKDCSLAKIDQICQATGIRFADLLKAIEARELVEVEFTPTQEEFFLSNRPGFLLYWLFVYERRPLEKCLDVLKIDAKTAWSYLRKLDRLNLLKVLPGDRITLPQPTGIRWIGRTRFVLDLYKKWGVDLINDALKKIADPERFESADGYFTIRYLKMSDSTWQEFKLALENLELQFSNRATTEMRMQVADLKHVRWITAVDNKSWVGEST